MRKKTFKVIITTTRQYNAIYYPKTRTELTRIVRQLHDQYGYEQDGTFMRVLEGYFDIDD